MVDYESLLGAIREPLTLFGSNGVDRLLVGRLIRHMRSMPSSQANAGMAQLQQQAVEGMPGVGD